MNIPIHWKKLSINFNQFDKSVTHLFLFQYHGKVIDFPSNLYIVPDFFYKMGISVSPYRKSKAFQYLPRHCKLQVESCWQTAPNKYVYHSLMVSAHYCYGVNMKWILVILPLLCKKWANLRCLWCNGNSLFWFYSFAKGLYIDDLE